MTTHVLNIPSIPPQALPVITVNGVVIDENELASELQYHRQNHFPSVLQQAGQALVIRQLLLQQAGKAGLVIDADNEEAAIQQLLDNEVVCDEPDDNDCRRYFANNPEKFKVMPLMEVEHILLAAAKDDPSARADAYVAAQAILVELKRDPSLFAELALQHSACPSKKDGGALGSISKGQTVPEFERQLMYFPQGLSDKIIETRYGYHIVNVVHRVDSKPLAYSVVADKVRDYLAHRASRLAVQAYIQRLVEDADIEGIEIKFADDNVHI